MGKGKNKSLFGYLKPLFYCAIVLGIIGCGKDYSVNPIQSEYDFKLTADESAKIHVGLYIDYGVWDGTITTMTTMLKGINCNYTIITKDTILNGNLDRYSLIIMPGGDMWKDRDDLSSNGMTKIKDYVSLGGGYFGICGGAYFGTNKITWHGWANEPRININITGLNLLAVNSEGPIDDFAPTYIDVKCKVNIVGKDHAVAQHVPDDIEIYYNHGPLFLMNSNTDISVIGKTANGNKTTMIASSCGLGRVFLTGHHPEVDDTHISWILVKNAIQWCSKEVE
jgi:glutamine amidotransferase-like uncharacterized protein